MEMIFLYGLTEFATEIPGMDRKKLSVYYSRGKLPEPFAKAGNRPLWTKDQVEQFAKTLNPKHDIFKFSYNALREDPTIELPRGIKVLSVSYDEDDTVEFVVDTSKSKSGKRDYEILFWHAKEDLKGIGKCIGSIWFEGAGECNIHLCPV